VVTRSSGQQSLGYGRIEDLFAGGVLETPAGVLELPAFPASAAGPDLKQLVLGSEGRIGILTEATVRVSPLPEREEWRAYFLPDWDRGLEAVRALAQSRLPLSMLRLSTPGETETALALSSRQQLVAVLRKVSAWRGIGGEACLLLTALTGSRRVVSAVRRSASRVIRASRGVSAGRFLAEGWRRGRFKTPYLRNTLWERGYAVDTLETAASWSLVPALLRSVESALGTALDSMGERVHVFSHVSHVYGDGASLYATYVFRRGDDAQDTLERWLVLKQAATRAIMLGGGTLSHHHGVGTDLRADLTREKGALGVEALRAAFGCFDPDNIMNPGKLLPERPFSVLGSLP
jgi:alkyldihydroxyacetonephosphate synthase